MSASPGGPSRTGGQRAQRQSIFGRKITLFSSGLPAVEISVSRIAQRPAYYGGGGRRETPRRRGYLFFEVYFTYNAFEVDVQYGPGDWQLRTREGKTSAPASTRYGPRPRLREGSLAMGTRAGGWLVWEAPRQGPLFLEYRQPIRAAPIFEMQVRWQ